MITAPADAILIVDDDPGIRRVLQFILEDEGYAVCAAQHGREALTQLEHCHPALLLVDLNMPVMSGWELIAALHDSPRPLPVIVMTAGRSARTEAARLGASGWLEKPFALEAVLRAVATSLRAA